MNETPASDTTRQEIEIDFFRIEDAPGIARLFASRPSSPACLSILSSIPRNVLAWKQLSGNLCAATFMHRPRVQTIQVPMAYRDELSYLYAGLNVERTFVFSINDLPAEGSSQGSMNLFDLAQVFER
jgi:hypothetical protein